MQKNDDIVQVMLQRGGVTVIDNLYLRPKTARAPRVCGGSPYWLGTEGPLSLGWVLHWKCCIAGEHGTHTEFFLDAEHFIPLRQSLRACQRSYL
jgi:hypothetical protein